jgi:Bacillus transposase protein.
MVIYNSADSDNLIQALSTNIKTAKEVFDKVKQGTQHLSSVIDSGTLSGSAYRAGQSLFQTYITPMIQKLDSAIDDIQSDLDSYKKAEQHVRALDSHLDENYLKGMLNNTNQMIRLIEQKIQEDKKVMEKLANLHFDELVKGLQEIPGLEQQLENMKQLKHDYEKKIQALQTFASSTNSLFTDSLQAFKYALQGVDIINQSKASVDGTITFPAGADMSWSSKLQNEKFSSTLIKETKTKADKIEVKWTALNGAGEQYPLIYVNGKLDKEKTSDARWAMTKMGWANFKKMSPEVLAELLCINDFKTLLDPKSSFAENGMSLFSILLTFVPETKAVELVKAMKAAKMLETGGETLVDLEKISKVAGLTESETKAFSKVISSENLAKVGKVKLPPAVVKTSERFSESAIGDYAKTMSANYTQKNIDDLTKLTTHNGSSNTALLGKYTKDSVTSYEQIAYENGFTYFDAGNQGWADIANVNPQLAYDVNAQFLKEQIQNGKEFVLSDNPDEAMNLFKQLGDKAPSYSKEMEQLREAGYSWVKDGEFWRAIK